MSRPRIALVVGVAVAAVAVASCFPLQVPRVGERPPRLGDEDRERAYQAVLARYSDRAERYDRLDTRFFVHATYQGWDFREARVRRAAAFRSLPPPEVERLLAEERAAHAAGHQFFLAIHFHDPKYDDLDRGEKSVWRLALVTERGEVTPAKVERLGRSNLDARSLYPYFDEFWLGYRLTFPRAFADGAPVVPEGAERVTLRVASPLGAAELAFPAR